METDELAQCLGSISSDEENIELSEEVANLLGIKVVDPVTRNPEPVAKQTRKPGRPARDYTNVYSCTVCDKKYNTQSKLSSHELIHNPEASYSCDVCEASFKQKANLTVHARKHDVDAYSVCSYCEYKTYDKSALYRHELVHRNARSYICDVCGLRFNTDLYLRQHKEAVHDQNKQFSCTLCSFKSFSATGVHSHTKNVHTEEGKYSCNVCSMELKTRTTFLIHYRRHLPAANNTEVTCTLCNKTFNNSKLLSQHNKQKHKEKNFWCCMCSKKFAFKSKLQQHMVTHSDIKPYSCPYPSCQHTCNKMDNLHKHIKRMHKPHNTPQPAQVELVVSNEETVQTVEEETEAVSFLASPDDAVANEVILT